MLQLPLKLVLSPFNGQFPKPRLTVVFARECETFAFSQDDFRRCADDGIADQMSAHHRASIVAERDVQMTEFTWNSRGKDVGNGSAVGRRV